MTVKTLLFGAFLILVGCQTSPTRYSEVEKGSWEGRVLVKDLKQNKSYILNFDINAIKNQALRMDVTGALSTPIAVMVVSPSETRYVLIDKKAYFEGVTQAKAMKPILSVPMDPMLLFHILFETPEQGAKWHCERDEKGFLVQCEDMESEVRVVWSERRGRRKTIKIFHPQAELQMNFNSFEAQLDEKENLFSLSAPKGFKHYRIK